MSLHSAIPVGLLLLAALGVAFEGPSCPCVKPLNSDREWIEIEFRSSEVVFEGELVSYEDRMTRYGKERFFTYRVVNLYKGSKKDAFNVQHHIKSCEFEFKPGRHYLVYASHGPYSGLSANICGRTNLLERGTADLRYLRGEPPAEEDLLREPEKSYRRLGLTPETAGAVCGTIRGPDGAPFERAFVSVRDAESKEPVTVGSSGSDGTFRIGMLRSGRYFLAAYGYRPRREAGVLHAGVYPSGSLLADAVPLDVAWAEQRCGLDFVLQPQPVFSISGVVERADYGPLPEDVTVDLSSLKENAFSFGRIIQPERDGSFQLQQIPGGQYSIRAYVPLKRGQSKLEHPWEQAITEVHVDSAQYIRLTIRKWRD